MISSVQIQSAYVDLYTQMRKYIWGFDTVEKLANLEVASYKTFPSIDEVSNCFDKLQACVQDVSKDDEDFKKAFDAFSEAIHSEGDLYAKLNQVREVVQL